MPGVEKSLYRNVIDSTSVYFVSSKRPNSILMSEKHNIHVEANIFNWFEKSVRY